MYRPIRFHRMLRLRNLRVAQKPKPQTDFKPSNWLLYAAMIGIALLTVGVLTAIAMFHA